MLLFLAFLLLGPRETLAGKFPGHAPEYLERYPEAPVPLPDPLPTDVDALCRLVEVGHATAEVYAALGDALFAKGEKALAYRAFHAAQAKGDVGMQEKKDRCGYVDPLVIELEWEHGTFPNEDGRDEPERFFPRWAWPAAGDRVWAEGHWVFDCGHATMIDGARHFRSEIHPARAIAAMRQQVQTLPGSGATYVPVTATDLYIHGRAGYIGDILTYGH